MQYLAMVAVMAMLGAGTGGTALMAADFGHGAPDETQAQNQWTDPADFGNGPGDCAGEQYRHAFGENPEDGRGGYAYQIEADADGDGIPNGQDPDWQPPKDGTGYQWKRGKP